MSRVRLKPFLAWTTTSETLVSVAGGGLEVFIEGEHAQLVAALLPELDGRPLETVAEACGIDEEDLEGVLDALRTRNLIDEIEDEESFDDRSPMSPFTYAPQAAAKKLAAAEILLLGDGRAAKIVATILDESGVGKVKREGSGADFVILALDAPSAGALDRAWKSAAGSAFTPLIVEGASAIVGPTAMKGHACPTCFEVRRNNLSLSTNARAEMAAALLARTKNAEPNAPLIHQAAAIASREAILHCSGVMTPVLCDRVVDIAASGEARWHQVLAVPNCSRCGGPPE